MQITNNFNGESKNPLLNVCHPERKLSCTQAPSVKEFVHRLRTPCSFCGSICEDIHLIKWGLRIEPTAVPRTKRGLTRSLRGVRACRRAAAETDWRCHSQRGTSRCCPPSPRAALKPAPLPRWGSGAGGSRPWRG